jgi:hypothetical protein
MEDIIEKFWHRVYFNLEKGYLKACIERAYLDFCRTLEIKQYDAAKWVEIKKELTQIIEEQIIQMLSKKMTTQKEFDEWHHRAMLHLISKGEESNLTSQVQYLTLGQAQKWINMTLKYVYAVGESKIKNAWANYTYYHVPIDNIIQEQLKQHNVKPLEMAWSRLNQFYRYEVFQQECRIAFPKEIMIEVEMELFNR